MTRWATLVLLALAACRHTPPPASATPWEGRELVPIATRPIRVEGELVGRLREFECPDPVRPWRIHLLENRWGQWLGWIDGSGRAFKLEPFATEPRLIGTGNLAWCVQALMGVPGSPELGSPEGLER